MSLTPPSVSRNASPVERSQQRAERAPAGDFAALLDLTPAPARAPLARASARRDDRAPAGGHDERSQTAPARSRHTHSGDGVASAAHGRSAPASEHSRGRDGWAGESHVPSVPTDAPAAAPVEAGSVPAAPPPVLAPVDMAAIGSGSPAGELPVAAVAAVAIDPAAAMATLAPVAVHQPVVEAPTDPPPPLAFAPAGLPVGTGLPGASGSAATTVAATEGAKAAEAALPGVPGNGTAVSAETAPATPDAAATAVAAPTGTVAPESASSTAEARPALAVEAPAEHADAEAESSTTAERAANVPTGAGAGSGAGSGSARDGATGRFTVPEEISEAPAGVPAATPAAAPAATQGIGRGPDAVPFGPHRSVPLERAPRAVAQLLHVASESGVSHARIALRPVELGGIEIFLQVSPAGLAAQVIADSPEAARMLAQATEDLRRSLAGQNVELVSIDVSTSAEQQQRDDLASSGFGADDGRTPDGPSAPSRGDARLATPDVTSESTTPTVLELPDGLLVDVLA